MPNKSHAKSGAGRSGRRGKSSRRQKARPLGAKTPLFLATGLLGFILWLAAQVPMPHEQLPPRQGPSLQSAQSWGYQLQKVRTRRIPNAIDLLVVDYSKDGSQARAFTPRDVAKLQKRRDGSRRIVLAYLSIGEAESYRNYWQPLWRYTKPRWLGRENEDWPGNYAVRYWHEGWQKLIMKPDRSGLDAIGDLILPARKAYLDRILEAGFDGVYLDRVDSFDDWDEVRNGADKDMILFVARLSAYAKTRKPGFLVVPQNGEELLKSAHYRSVIDAVAKEDLYFGIDDDGVANTRRQIARTEKHLRRARHAGHPVFVVEYLEDEDKRRRAYELAERRGYVIHFATRSLDQPPSLAFGQLRSRRYATGRGAR